MVETMTNQADHLRLEYVLLDTAVRWEKNPKKHDEGAIWKSIARHGFKDPSKWEPTLNGGKGGLVEGNGRSHVLAKMHGAGEPAPRGIIVDGEGKWLVPILFGVDAASEREAEAYGVDHNNLTLLGGDFGPLAINKLWDDTAYAALLADLANHEALPVSVDGEDVDALIAQLAGPTGSAPSGGGGYDSFSQEQSIVKTGKSGNSEKSHFGVLVVCEDEGEQRAVFDELTGEGRNVLMQGVPPKE